MLGDIYICGTCVLVGYLFSLGGPWFIYILIAIIYIAFKKFKEYLDNATITKI